MFGLDASTASLGGDIVSAATSIFGGSSANKAASKEGKRNRAWMERMSNTAYQRATADMQAAGINPMLAYMKGGADTPSSQQVPVKDVMEGASRSIGGAVEKALAIKNVQASNAKLEAETKNTEANTAKIASEIPNIQQQTSLSKAQEYKIGYENAQILQNTSLAETQQRKVNSEITNLATQNRLTEASISETLARTNLTREQINKIAPEILKIYADIAYSNSRIGFEETKSALGDFFSNSGRDNNSLGQDARKVFEKAVKPLRDKAKHRKNFKSYEGDF